MKPISPVLPGSKEFEIVLAKDQPEYIALPALYLEDPDGRFVTRWEFTEQERETVAAGGDLVFTQMTFGSPFHPVSFQIVPAVSKEEDSAASVSKTLSGEEAETSGEGVPGRP